MRDGSLTPLEAEGRIHALDVLRGVALAGMLLVHFHDAAGEGSGWTAGLLAAIELFASERFFALFAFLFGAGFAIQLGRADRSGVPFVRIYLRRLLGLFVFGLVAHALLGFAVLLAYSLFGVPLLLVRRWPTRTLLAAAVALTLGWAAYRFGVAALDWARWGPEAADGLSAERWRAFRESGEAVAAARRQESYLVLLEARLRHMAVFYAQPWMLVPNELALFLFGLLAVRARVFHETRRHTRLIVAAILVGGAAWAVSAFLLPGIPDFGPAAAVDPLRYSTRLGQWLMFSYAGTILLLWTHVGASRRLLRPFAWAGRMALTHYFVQIIILDLLFSGYALGLSELAPALVLPATVCLFGAQAAFSRWWLSVYRFGPLEWLWRSWTYGMFQPIRASGTRGGMTGGPRAGPARRGAHPEATDSEGVGVMETATKTQPPPIA